MAAPGAVLAANATPLPTTSPESTRTIALICIVVGTAMYLAFVAYKMRQRMSWGSCCGSAKEPEQAHREAVLAIARQLFQAAAKAGIEPKLRLPARTAAASATWRAPQPAAYTPPVLPLDEAEQLRSPRSPAAAAAHLEAVTAASPWSIASELSPQPPQLQQLQLPPRPASQGGVLDGPLTAPSAAAALGGTAALEQGGSPRAASPRSRWPTVRELVRAWGRSRSREGEAGGAARSGLSAADVLLDGGLLPGQQALGTGPVAGGDLESQLEEAVPVEIPVARALTWSQLGISPAASRHASEGGPGLSASLPPAAPLRSHPLAAGLLPGGEVHANPVFSLTEESSRARSSSGGEGLAAPAPASAWTGGASAGGHSSFTRQVQPMPSRLSRAGSFADPSLPADSFTAAAARPQSPPSGGRAAAGGEGSGHGAPLPRRSTPGPMLGHRRSGSGSQWGHEPQGGAGMRTRPSQQSLLSHAEGEGGLGPINE